MPEKPTPFKRMAHALLVEQLQALIEEFMAQGRTRGQVTVLVKHILSMTPTRGEMNYRGRY